MLNRVLDNLKIGIAIIDKDFNLKYLNRYLKELIIGDEIDFEKIQKRFGDAFSCKNIGIDITCGSGKSCQTCDIASLIENIYGDEEGVLFDIEIFSDRFRVNKKGKFELRGYPFYENGEKFIQLEVHEVTEKKVLEKNLEIKDKIQKKLQLFLDKIEDFIFYMDKDEKIEYCNNSYLKFLGKSYEDVIRKTESELVPQFMADKCKENTKIALELGTFFEEEKIGDKWYQTYKGKIELEDGSIGILGIVRDITSEKNRELDLKEKVYVDILTGLFNRNFFEEKLAIKKEYNNVTAILIDIDNFKTINDRFGHESGDKVLKSISDIIKINIRKEDYAIRMGGDEFLIFTYSDFHGAQKMAERILESARNIKVQDIYVSLSIGIGEGRGENPELIQIIRDADEALYYSKHSGKDTISSKNSK